MAVAEDPLTIIHGDALSSLRELESESVQCCVTSPPYWGLRDYGTATWEGGKNECDHVQMTTGMSDKNTLGPDMYLPPTNAANVGRIRQFKDICGKCGATRYDVQLGLEKTPDEYVGRLLEVFRELKRVLRSDGTVFLNLGDSYYGSWGNYGGQNRGNGKQRAITNGSQVPNPAYDGLEKFRPPTAGSARRARVCDNGGRAERGYQESDPFSESLCGGRTDFWWTHISDSDARLALSQSLESCHQTRVCTGALRGHLPIADCSTLPLIRQSLTATLDQARSALPALERLRAFLVSMPDGFALLLPENSRPLDMLSAFLSSLRSLLACVQRCVHMLDVSGETYDCKAGIVSLFAELADHIQGTSACCSLLFSWLNYSKPERPVGVNLKPKDLVGIPWRVAFALQSDGWYLRSDIIWSKPNPMPESVTDRPTKSHEYIFLLSKSERYYYDAEAIKEPAQLWTGQAAIFERSGPVSEHVLLGQSAAQHRAVRAVKQEGKNSRINISRDPSHEREYNGKNRREDDQWSGRRMLKNARQAREETGSHDAPFGALRNKRSVWSIATAPFPDAHFATFPPELVTPCILAGSKPGDVVIDPFGGSGTTGKVAIELGRKAILIEPKAEYVEMIKKRCQTTIGLPLAI